MMEVIYGINAITSAINNNINIIEAYISENKFENVRKILLEKNISINSLSNFDFEKYKLNKNINFQGIIAIITYELITVNELIEFAKQKKENPIIVFADKIMDPQNLGTIIRNISAFDAQGLIITKHNCAQINSTVHKVSSGNTFNTKIALANSSSNAIKELKKNGFWIVETKMNSEMEVSELCKYNQPLVIVMGNEGKGISPSISKNADISVHIKMNGKAESLNVAAASAIILHKLQK